MSAGEGDLPLFFHYAVHTPLDFLQVVYLIYFREDGPEGGIRVRVISKSPVELLPNTIQYTVWYSWSSPSTEYNGR